MTHADSCLLLEKVGCVVVCVLLARLLVYTTPVYVMRSMYCTLLYAISVRVGGFAAMVSKHVH